MDAVAGLVAASAAAAASRGEQDDRDRREHSECERHAVSHRNEIRGGDDRGFGGAAAVSTGCSTRSSPPFDEEG